MSRFSLVSFEGAVEKAHGRIERRSIDVLPANAAGIENDWSSVKHICRVTRFRQGKKNGQWNEPEKEVVYLIARFPNGEASPEALLSANRGHWGVDHASKQGRHPRRGRLHKSKRRSAAKHLFPYWLRAQNIEIRLALSNPSNRTVP